MIFLSTFLLYVLPSRDLARTQQVTGKYWPLRWITSTFMSEEATSCLGKSLQGTLTTGMMKQCLMTWPFPKNVWINKQKKSSFRVPFDGFYGCLLIGSGGRKVHETNPWEIFYPRSYTKSRIPLSKNFLRDRNLVFFPCF